MLINNFTNFSAINIEGHILPTDLLKRIADGDTDLGGLTSESYHLGESEKINEATNRAWTRLLTLWSGFRKAQERLPENDPGTTITREKWLLPLFQELGYGRLQGKASVEVEGKSYPISHWWQNVPIHLVGYGVSLDRLSSGVVGAARSSPHSLMQEFLNRSPEYLWGFVSNGKQLRILRDNVSLVRQAYVEFDLEAMMEGEAYSDFVMLWLLCHQSRVEAEQPTQYWLEKWSQSARVQGVRALEELREGVETAIIALGKGFISHKANWELRNKLKAGELDRVDYYSQLLRLVYRLIFLFVAEDRELLLRPDATPQAKELYQYYSAGRLRRLAEKRYGSRHADLYLGLRLIMEKLGSDEGCPELGLPALGSFLFSQDALKDLNQCEISNHDLLDAIRSLAFTLNKDVRRPIDYKHLGAEELGSVYESLLELYPDINVEVGSFSLSAVSGNKRKTTGSYYTPTSLINCLLDSALDPVLDEAVKSKNPEEALLDLKVCDPACGSGHFLIAAAHRIARRLASVRTGVAEPAPESTRTALRDVIGRCIYGVDINPMAIDLCKVGLWMEALEPGKPLSFLDHHIQCGNSLIGATLALLKDGIPDEAFNHIEGDNKTLCSEYKKRNKKERTTKQKELFDPEGNLWIKIGNLAKTLMNLVNIDDDTMEGIKRKQHAYEKLVRSSDYRSNQLLADAWCAAFVWKKEKSKDLPYPITEEVFRKIEENPFNFENTFIEKEVRRLAEQYQFFHWHLAFPDVFRVGDGEESENNGMGWSGGFSVVLGNPPWERIKLQEKEWFAARCPDISQASNAAARKRMIEALKESSPYLYNEFLEDCRRAEGDSHIIRNSGMYPLCGRGDINTYTIFAEQMRHVVSDTGRIGCIVPSGIATDDTTKYFFQNLIETQTLNSLYDFENREAIFQGVHRSYKFCLLTLTGTSKPTKEGAEFVFFAHSTDDLDDATRRFSLSAQDIYLLNPNTKTCPIFRSKRDADLTKAIYKRVPVLINENSQDGNPWGIKFSTMFHMSNDSHLFHTREHLESDGWKLDGNVFRKCKQEMLPLYEAKMIHHYDHRWATYEGLETRDLTIQEKANPELLALPRYWVLSVEVKNRLDNPNQQWLVGFRDVTNTTNERTAIFSVMPQVGVGHKAPLIFLKNRSAKENVSLLSCVSSTAFDYVTRQSVGGTSLGFFILKQLPVLPPSTYLNIYTWAKVSKTGKNINFGDWLLPRILELTYTTWDLQPFAKDCGYNGPPFQWNEERRFLLRCELDAAYFHLYQIKRDDADYIMETFPIIKRKDEQLYGEYRTKRVILEIYDAMAQAMETGNPYQTLLNPLPADPSVAHRV
jgi:hypothetical protein